MNTKVITGIVKLAYAHIFEAYAVEGIEGIEPRYSTTIIIPKTDIETLKSIDAAIGEAKKESKYKGAIRTPMRNGDLERPEDPLYKGCYFLTVTSKNKPGIVDINVESKSLMDEYYDILSKLEVLIKKEVNDGCLAKVSLNLYGYDLNGNKGIAAGLNNIQLIGGFL